MCCFGACVLKIEGGFVVRGVAGMKRERERERERSTTYELGPHDSAIWIAKELPLSFFEFVLDAFEHHLELRTFEERIVIVLPSCVCIFDLPLQEFDPSNLVTYRVRTMPYQVPQTVEVYTTRDRIEM